MNTKIIQQGAEATISLNKNNQIVKSRIPKIYRIKELDEKIRKKRTKGEAKLLEKAGKIIPTPKIIEVDEKEKIIIMELIEGKKLAEHLNNFTLKEQLEICKKIGKSISKIHKEGIIHGDLTTSNMILKDNKVFFIDFGLGYQNGKYEDKAVDLHVLKQALEAKHFTNWEKLWEAIERGYLQIDKAESKKVLERLKIVERRGRYKH